MFFFFIYKTVVWFAGCFEKLEIITFTILFHIEILDFFIEDFCILINLIFETLFKSTISFSFFFFRENNYAITRVFFGKWKGFMKSV